MPYYDKEAILERLTKRDVTEIVMDLGSGAPKHGSHGELIFQTVCHGGDSYKLYYYEEATDKYPGKIFVCYTQCSESFSIWELVLRAKRAQGINWTFYKAIKYIVSMMEGSEEDFKMDGEPKKKIDDWSWINKFKRLKESERGLPELTPIDDTVLQMFCYTPHEEFLQDNISREVLSEFEIGYWGKTNQIIIPHRDRNYNLVGVRGRFLDKEDIDRIGKYVPLLIEDKFLSHSLGSNLYGIHINQNKIMQCKKVMLLESEKGVMQNHTYFGKDDFSLAVCGSELTQEQIRLLLRYLQVEEVILGYDKEFEDDDEIKQTIYRNKLFKKAADLLPYFKVSILWDDIGVLDFKDAPTDKGKDALLALLDNKKVITTKDLEVLE